MTSKILVDKRDGVGWVTINNPARRNAISLEMWEAMGAAFADFSADGAIRCAVIHGSGDKAFASGADISQFEKNRSNAAASEAYGKISKGVRDQIMAFDQIELGREP